MALLDIHSGWLTSQVRRCPSPNFNARPAGVDISLLVIHNISLPPGEFLNGHVEDFFNNCLQTTAHPYFATIANLEVSAHCFIKRDGELVQFVSFLDRAWHAGKSIFAGRENCNDFSIGVELEGTDQLPYTDEQYQCLTRLTRILMQTYTHITPERIVGHEHIAPGRKTDPGPAFDWYRFQQGLTPL